MTRKNIIILSSIIFILLIFFVFFMPREDAWICKNGEWIKHGNPSIPMPATSCEENKNIGEGRTLVLYNFREGDIKNSAKVCIIGKTVVEKLFKNDEDPIGKIIRYNNIPFQVIGVLK